MRQKRVFMLVLLISSLQATDQHEDTTNRFSRYHHGREVRLWDARETETLRRLSIQKLGEWCSEELAVALYNELKPRDPEYALRTPAAIRGKLRGMRLHALKSTNQSFRKSVSTEENSDSFSESVSASPSTSAYAYALILAPPSPTAHYLERVQHLPDAYPRDGKEEKDTVISYMVLEDPRGMIYLSDRDTIGQPAYVHPVFTHDASMELLPGAFDQGGSFEVSRHRAQHRLPGMAPWSRQEVDYLARIRAMYPFSTISRSGVQEFFTQIFQGIQEINEQLGTGIQRMRKDVIAKYHALAAESAPFPYELEHSVRALPKSLWRKSEEKFLQEILSQEFIDTKNIRLYRKKFPNAIRSDQSIIAKLESLRRQMLPQAEERPVMGLKRPKYLASLQQGRSS